MGYFKPIPASFLFVLCVLLCGFHLRSRVCIAFRNVSNPGAWAGHVHCRFCIVDRYILDWAAYPWMLQNLTPAGTFFLFAAMCIPYMLIVWKLVPETTGKSLEEIERYWMKTKIDLNNRYDES